MIVQNPIPITEKQLHQLARQARGRITRIYLHWTAGHYGQVFDDYHLNIDRDGTVYVTCDDFGERKSHTWQRNSGTIGIALCCGYGADCALPTAICARAAISAVYDGEERDRGKAEDGGDGVAPVGDDVCRDPHIGVWIAGRAERAKAQQKIADDGQCHGEAAEQDPLS